MTAAPPSPLDDFVKTFFRTRSLWRFFGFFWAFMTPVIFFWTASVYISPAWCTFIFLPLCALLAVGFVLYKKKNPDFLYKTEHREILKSGTLAQKLAVMLFISLFGGPLGWGAAVWLGLIIYVRAVHSDINVSYNGFLFGVSFAFAAFMAASLWVEGIADRKKRILLQIVGAALFLAFVLFMK